MTEHWGGRWRLACCQVRGDGSRELFDRYKIGYDDLNGGIDERGFLPGPGKAGMGTLVSPKFRSRNYYYERSKGL